MKKEIEKKLEEAKENLDKLLGALKQLKEIEAQAYQAQVQIATYEDLLKEPNKNINE